MKTRSILILTLILILAAFASRVDAHEGEETGATVEASATKDGNTVEASIVVTGTVQALKGALYRVERWPELFTDVRGLKRNADGIWSVDFRLFQHPHDFHIERTPTGVVLELASDGHGAARMEYLLDPLDATHSKLRVRYSMATPPEFTTAQVLALLGAKARVDLNDFAAGAPKR